MSSILVVDNSKWFTSLVASRIESEHGLNVKAVQSYADAVALIEQEDFFAALVGLYLEDADVGEIVDFVISHEIPVIVFTGKYSDDIRDKILSRKVIDYVLKEDAHSLDYIVALIRRIQRNDSVKVLVVDDSQIVRRHISELLTVHRFQVFTANDGREAEEILAEHPDMRMVITDYDMPNMDGFHLIKKIRKNYSKEEMAIIGMSSKPSTKLSARFIKNGANDFMIKPFLAEEFYCRINQNIEMIERIREIREISNRDYLTGLFNRKHFLETGRRLHAELMRMDLPFATVVIGVDYLRMVNDRNGLDAGDLVLCAVARSLAESFPFPDIVSRISGDEFACFVTNSEDIDFLLHRFEDFRKKVEKIVVSHHDQEIRTTVSIGICTRLTESFEMMIQQANYLLTIAKDEGRNLIMHSEGRLEKAS